MSGALLFIGPDAVAQTVQVRPLAACIEVGETPASFRAYFGYESRERSFAQVPEGNDNVVLPAGPGRRPLTLFIPGLHTEAFRVEFQPSAEQPVVSWFFQGTRIDAGWESRRCGARRIADEDFYYRFADGFE